LGGKRVKNGLADSKSDDHEIPQTLEFRGVLEKLNNAGNLMVSNRCIGKTKLLVEKRRMNECEKMRSG